VVDPSKRRLPIAGGGSTADAPARIEPTPGAKRKLPVLASEPDEEMEARPPWHWVALGTVAIFVAWLPLAGLANTLLRRMLERVGGAEAPPSVRAAMVGLNVLAFVLAGVAGGFLVGRFGGRAGQREATASGVVVAAIAWTLAVAEGAPAGVLGWAVLLVVMVTIGGGASHAGGRAGLRARSRGAPLG
jgi:disulfide bond formation protein DsbB